MRKVTLALMILVVSVLGNDIFAQSKGKYGADSAECIKYLSYYQEYYKQKNYTDALPNWRKAYKYCPPTASQNMLIHGTSLLQREIAKTKDATLRQAMVDSLLKIQDQRAETYPKYKVDALNNKGRFVVQYNKDSEVIHEELEKIIAENGTKTWPKGLLANFDAVVSNYEEKKTDADDVLDTYQRMNDLLDKMVEEDDNEDVRNVITSIDSKFSSTDVASCDKLIELYEPRYEENPTDMNFIKSLVVRMSNTEGCQDNDLFLKAVTSMHENEPSASSAYYLYRLNSARGNSSSAVSYLEQAINFEGNDDATKANYEIELATYCFKNGMNGKAFDYANKAASHDESLQGKAYYLIGTIWGSVTCGGDEIEKRAKYWVAVDCLQKARNYDESIAEDASKLISQYSVYFPQKSEAFMYDVMDGQSYSVNCGGMHATTIVRTQK